MVVWAFNPGFYTDEELLELFCVRSEALQSLVASSRARTPTNQHTLVIGQRGFGKTMLLRRFAAELRRDSELEARWFPVVFAEESYPVASAGELWLEALTHLADATGDARWQRAYLELRKERDDARLRVRALAQLLDFADLRGRGLVIIIENVDKLLGAWPDPEGWALRETLLHERRIQLIAATPRRFEGADDPSQPFYELFRRVQLEPLTDEEIETLWTRTTGENLPRGRATALRILTGGNPRLVVLLATVANGMTLRDLVRELAHLIDQHTNYFTANIEAITSPEMRRTFLALAEHWSPATARQIAEATRSEVSQTSTLLARLVDQGRVEVVRPGKVQTYQVAERLYNIYYLMRRRGVHEARVTALVDFMALFLEPREVPRLLVRFAHEACDPSADRALTAALVARFAKGRDGVAMTEFLAKAPRAYLTEHAPARLKRRLKAADALVVLLGREDGAAWLEEAVDVMVRMVERGNASEALPLVRAIVPLLPVGVSVARDLCGWALADVGDDAESLRVSPPRETAPTYLTPFWFLRFMLDHRPDQALPFLEDFERWWPTASRAELDWIGWAWIAEAHARRGDLEQALAVAEAHPVQQVFLGLLEAVGAPADRLVIARRWTQAIPEDASGWLIRYAEASSCDEGAVALGRVVALKAKGLAPLATFAAAQRGDIEGSLVLLAHACAEPPDDDPDEDSDEARLAPSLILLARTVDPARLVTVLRDTPAAARLEPIYVALLRRAGEAVEAPREILELADEVDRRIEERP